MCILDESSKTLLTDRISSLPDTSNTYYLKAKLGLKIKQPIDVIESYFKKAIELKPSTVTKHLL